MKVGITTEYMDKRRTGIGNYTRSLVKGLLKMKNDYDIDIYAILIRTIHTLKMRIEK